MDKQLKYFGYNTPVDTGTYDITLDLRKSNKPVMNIFQEN